MVLTILLGVIHIMAVITGVVLIITLTMIMVGMVISPIILGDIMGITTLPIITRLIIVGIILHPTKGKIGTITVHVNPTMEVREQTTV